MEYNKDDIGFSFFVGVLCMLGLVVSITIAVTK